MTEQNATNDARTIEVRTQHDGVFRIEVPSDWKITFSKVNPQGNGFENALRIYEGEEKQRACFTGVVSFRDLSIPFKRRVKNVKAKSESERNGRKRSASHEVETDYEWTEDAGEGLFE